MRSVLIERPRGEEIARRVAGWRGWVWVWGPVVLALIVIRLESTKTMSAENTAPWIRPIVEKILGHINDRLWNVIHHAVRKTGHFCGYGLVCAAFLRAWLLRLAGEAAMTVQRWRWQSTGLAVLSTIVVASLDEWHQTFLPNRTGKVSDVMIDTLGGLTVSGVIWLVAAWRRRVRREVFVAA